MVLKCCTKITLTLLFLCQIMLDVQVVDTISLNSDEYINLIQNDVTKTFALNLFRICSHLFICEYSVNSAEILANDSNCCFNCICDETCMFTKSCCPHMNVMSQAFSMSAPPANSRCGRPRFFQKGKGGISPLSDYAFVNKCPQNSSAKLKNMCEHPNIDNGFSLNDIHPVSTGNDVTNFDNKHCAECNGVDDGEFWIPKLVCDEIEDGIVLLEEIKSRPGCHLTYEPPREINVTSTQCLIEVVSECNVTGLWSVFDDTVVAMCRSISIVYSSLSRWYNNIFCAMCNGENIVYVRPLCKENNLASEMSMMLDFRMTFKEDRPVTSQEECSIGDQHDPLMNKCSAIHCTLPLLVDPYRKTCIDVIQSQSTDVYAVPVRATPRRPLLYDINKTGLYKLNLQKQVLEIPIVGSNLCHCEMYFKLDVLFKKLKDTHPTDEIYVMDIVAVLYFIPTGDTKPSLIYNELRRKLPLKLSKRVSEFDLRPGYLDPWMLKSALADSFEDSYDGLTMVTDRQLMVNTRRNTCARYVYNVTYGVSFMQCPSFLYDVQSVSLERFTGGLRLKGTSAEIKFGEFLSLNQSHVLICVDSVRAVFSSIYAIAPFSLKTYITSAILIGSVSVF